MSQKILIAPDLDKTIITSDTEDYLKELKKQKEDQEQEEERVRLEKEEEEKNKVDIDNDATQVVNLKFIRSELLKEAAVEEKELTVEKKEHVKNIKRAEKERKRKEKKEEEYEEYEEEPKKMKLLPLIAVMAIAAYLFLPEEEKKQLPPIKIIYPQISFPVRYDTDNIKMAKDLYNKGISLDKKPTYINKIKQAQIYKQSVENQFFKNKALGKLVFTYADLLENSKNIHKDANTLFKLIQVLKGKELSNPDITSGVSLFYYHLSKYNACVNTIDKFNAVKLNKPTINLFGVYLSCLMKQGSFDKAEKVAMKLEGVKSLPLFTSHILYQYYYSNAEYEKSA